MSKWEGIFILPGKYPRHSRVMRLGDNTGYTRVQEHYLSITNYQGPGDLLTSWDSGLADYQMANNS